MVKEDIVEESEDPELSVEVGNGTIPMNQKTQVIAFVSVFRPLLVQGYPGQLSFLQLH